MATTARTSTTKRPQPAKRTRPARSINPTKPDTPAAKLVSVATDGVGPVVASDKATKKKKDAARDKRVRGTFTLVERDFARIAALKAIAKRTGVKARKSELVLLGLRALQALKPAELHDQLLSLRVERKA